MNGPGFWMYETSGTLRPAVEAYLYNRPMTTGQITKMRQYLAQWINAPVWSDGPDIDHLREGIDGLTTREAIRDWLDAAEDVGIDPL
jgi:hypothetical protein